MYEAPSTNPTDLTKVDVLARALRRVGDQVATHGITATTLSLFGLYERMYNDAPGPEAVLVNDDGEWGVVAA
jgi:hypothetical protein